MSPEPMRTRAQLSRSLWLAVVGLLATAFTPAMADVQTKIVSINGDYATTHDAQITVYPGDSVQLSADQLDVDYYGTSTSLNSYVEDFQWSSDIGNSDICDPEYDCSVSNFEVNSVGVSFEVPYTMPEYVTITVQHRTDGTYDQLTLVNGANGGSNYDDSYADPDDYPEQDEFDYNRGLAGHGRWVYIHGERSFVPYAHTADWRPYQHGRWIWTSYGWTWDSYDPWGYVTDHYGYWRNHDSYGWVWFPFQERRWHPAVVSWFHTDQGIGWYPYWNGNSRGYRHGYSHGYRDGYWDGYRAGLASSGYNWGWSYVQHSHFTNVNIYHVRVTNVRIHDHYGRAYRGGSYGVKLRDHRHSHPRQFVESRMGRRIDATPVRVVTRRGHGGGDMQWVRPERRAVPNEYGQARRSAGDRVRHGTRVPVGSVVTPDGRVTRPSRPVVSRPNVPGRNGGEARPMPDRNRVPADRPRPTNPRPQPLPNRPAPAPRPDRPSRPERPAPAPRPERPAPAPRPDRPSRPERPAPAPRPERPAPAPRPDRPSRPERPAPAPRPERPAPAPRPDRPSRPERPAPAPRPERPAPAPRPERPAPAPRPDRPSRPERPAPAPRPERPAPAPRPDRPSRPERPAPAPRPERPAPAPRPDRPSRPERPSRPDRSAPAPRPERPSKPERSAPRPRRSITEVSVNVNHPVLAQLMQQLQA